MTTGKLKKRCQTTLVDIATRQISFLFWQHNCFHHHSRRFKTERLLLGTVFPLHHLSLINEKTRLEKERKNHYVISISFQVLHGTKLMAYERTKEGIKERKKSLHLNNEWTRTCCCALCNVSSHIMISNVCRS
jgi:hypothetical protein